MGWVLGQEPGCPRGEGWYGHSWTQPGSFSELPHPQGGGGSDHAQGHTEGRVQRWEKGERPPLPAALSLSVCPVRVAVWAWPVTPAVGRWPGAPAVPRPHCSLEALLPGLCHPGMTCSLVP